jgi:hypothetical protein
MIVTLPELPPTIEMQTRMHSVRNDLKPWIELLRELTRMIWMQEKQTRTHSVRHELKPWIEILRELTRMTWTHMQLIKSW